MSETPQQILKRVRNRVYRRTYEKKREEQAWLIRWWLFDIMGNHCSLCGVTEDLALDHHPEPRKWPCNKLNQYRRAKLYLRDWAAGNLRILCRSCNCRDGAVKRWHWAQSENPRSLWMDSSTFKPKKTPDADPQQPGL